MHDVSSAQEAFEARSACDRRLVAQRLEEAFESIDGTPYADDVASLISMLPDAEAGSQLDEFARLILGLEVA